MSSPLRRRRRFEPAETDEGGLIRPPRVVRNEHLKHIEQHFGALKRETADIPADLTCVFLCFVNRSGSNYLAELLASSCRYNRAGEILNYPAVIEMSKSRRFTRFQDFFAHLVTRQQQSGRFFVKAALQHLEILTRAGVLDQIADRSQFIMLERNDVLGQAISFALAFATRAFSSEVEGSADPQDIAYSRETIDRYLDTVAMSRQQFATFFGRNGIVPFRMMYEQLVADPEGEVTRLARELGLPDFALDMSSVRLQRQAGPVNDEWRRRYLSERQ